MLGLLLGQPIPFHLLLHELDGCRPISGLHHLADVTESIVELSLVAHRGVTEDCNHRSEDSPVQLDGGHERSLIGLLGLIVEGGCILLGLLVSLFLGVAIIDVPIVPCLVYGVCANGNGHRIHEGVG